MKKLIAVLMLFALLAGMAACNKAPAEAEPTPEPTPDEQALQAASDTNNSPPRARRVNESNSVAFVAKADRDL